MVNLSHLAVPETGQEQKPGAGIFPETDPVEKDQRRARQLDLHWHQLLKGGLLRAGALLCTQAIPWRWAGEPQSFTFPQVSRESLESSPWRQIASFQPPKVILLTQAGAPK